MSKSGVKDLKQLFQQARGGDAAALQALCLELQASVREVFQRKFQDRAVIDDLCQETFVRFLGNIDHVKEAGKLRGFACKVAFHVLQDHFREKYRSTEESLPTEYAGSEQVPGQTSGPAAADTSESDRLIGELDLEEAMRQLSPKSREIMILKSQGFNYDEIAAQVDLSVSGVKMQVKRSLEYLRSVLLSVTFLA